MKIAGIIAEYNPFHAGHAYHIQKTKELTGADYIIAVMSGDFVQRGGPAFLSKYIRTQMALLGGADVVLELPSTHSCESAELFSYSGVKLLHDIGCVDYLSFGSEHGDISSFQQVSHYLSDEPAAYKEKLRTELKNGHSFPIARRNALLEMLQQDMNWDIFLSQPNNILGIEYCKAISKLDSSITPITVQRKGSHYHDTDLGHSFPSATALRNAWDHSLHGFIPEAVLTYVNTLEEHGFPLTEEDFSSVIRWMLYTVSKADLMNYQDMSEDLAQRILNTRDSYQSLKQYLQLLKTKELTYNRIHRTIFHALLKIEQVPELSYARLLGFRQTAAPVLKEIKKRSSIPLLSKPADAHKILSPTALELFETNTRIASLYETVRCEKYQESFIHEFRHPLVVLP